MGVSHVPADLPAYTQGVAAARAALDEATFAAAWAQGRAMRPEQAVDEALASDTASTAALGAAPPVLVGLTQREREVLTQLARGLSNREIAEALVVSPKTVGRHLDNIYAKLGVSSRAAATAAALRAGLA
jgi:non-specific serine/threonine protein kinase